MHLRESGQALPLGIALLLACALTGVILFNTGEVVNEKTRLANTADAAVYSGITWQARALNFNAYTNRAMVANQVAMAQAVSLQSWAEYAGTTTANLSTVLTPVPIIGQIALAVNRVMSVIEPIVRGLGVGMLAVIDPINSALSVAQEAMYLSAFVASPEIMDKVAEANDPRIIADTAFSLAYLGNHFHDWSRLTDRFEKTDVVAMDERVAMINASTDPFTNDRTWNFFRRHLPVSPLLWFRIERSGSTRLLRDEETGETEWKALDTASLNSRAYYWFGRYKEVETPIGYAHKFANNQKHSLEDCTRRGLKRCKDWFGRNRVGQTVARELRKDLSGTTYKPKVSTAYRGVRAYRSLSEEIRRENNPRILLRTELRLPTADIKDAQALGIADRTIDSLSSGNEAALSSVSSAEVFFNRPEDDLRSEYASGYNPFWTVRLAPTTNTAKVAAMTLRGSAGTAFAVAANLAVYDGDGNSALPQIVDSGVQLERWSPALSGSTLEGIHSSAELIDGVLSDVFDDVLDRLFTGALSAGIDSAVGAGEQVLATIDVEALNDSVEEVHSDIDELSQRYAQARSAIQQQFAESAERLAGERDARTEAINESIERLEQERRAGAGADRDEEIHQEIQALIAERDGIGDEPGVFETFRETLANELVFMVKRTIPEWPITYRKALFVVDEYLRSGEDVTDQIDIVTLSNSAGG